MARKHRFFVPGLPVHVVQRGVNKCDIFANDKDRNLYIQFLAEASDKHDCPVHCYVLMGNHVHLLVTPGTDTSLPKTMQSLNGRYIKHFNRDRERTGPLWEGRYRAGLVDTDAYLKVCYQYIELNPVRAQFCNQPADYRWSSHRFHAYGEADPLVTLHRGYGWLGKTAAERQKRYQGWFREQLSDENLAAIRAGVRHLNLNDEKLSSRLRAT
jgi:putative transposase